MLLYLFYERVMIWDIYFKEYKGIDFNKNFYIFLDRIED